MQHHNDSIIKTRAGRLLYKGIPLTLLQAFEKGYSKFACERELETEQKLQYFDLHSYGRQRCVFLVLQMLNRRPRGSLCWVMAFFTASYQQLLWSPNSIGVPECLLGRVWLSLPHLVYNSLSNSNWNSNCLDFCRLSYIIVHAHSIAHSIFEIACLIVIKQKYLSCSSLVTLFRCVSL